MTKSPAQRFQTDDPTSHINYGGGVVGDQWSKPGAYGDDGMKSRNADHFSKTVTGVTTSCSPTHPLLEGRWYPNHL